MVLSWNEIKTRAFEFQNEWKDTVKENSEKQSFYNNFFDVFGITRRRVATFEVNVKKLNGNTGQIDLFWSGVLLVEHKSKGGNLEEAKKQAYEYCSGLKEYELPKYILLSDFKNFTLYDLDERSEHSFSIEEFHSNIKLFGFIAGYKKRDFQDLEPVNIEASELMGKLFDALKNSNYTEHDLELFLVRILFCLFADDTGIFVNNSFKHLMEERTNTDGSDTGLWISQLFSILDTPEDKRQSNLDEDIAAFPYVNGSLFEKIVVIPSFDSKMRDALISCCNFNWSNISPAIFGSLFQYVYDKKMRREKGEHYTSEENIMKLICPLFLDDLESEFEKSKNDKKKLLSFQKKIANLTFLDPACGCGNFLILAYREIRKLELKILKELYIDKKDKYSQGLLDISEISIVDVDKFYGIELEEFPAKIAEVAIWLIDHQMNTEISQLFGEYYKRIPLNKSAIIVNDNSLKIDWKKIIEPSKLSYILGNPPFVGARMKTKEQTEEIKMVFSSLKKGSGDLDYVCAWYKKAAEYIQGTNIKTAFVSTNSISQGGQVGILWGYLFDKYRIKIHFAHRTFKWRNEAKGNAHVHCVIIGFANFDSDKKIIFDYENINGKATGVIAKNINPYLIDYHDVIVTPRSRPICKVSEMMFGSMPNDDGNYLFTIDEMKDFIKKEPNSKKYFRPLLSAKEFLNGEERWCLWLKDASPIELSKLKFVQERIKNVIKYRHNSKRDSTRKLSLLPSLFGEIRESDTSFILFPLNSSARRKYIPIAFFTKKYITTNSCSFLPNASMYDFGILTSIMHMTWTKFICGRLKSDYRYSKDVVYNNFPWPKKITASQKKKVEDKASNVLKVREKYKNSSLAILYNPETMPPDLIKAHNELDSAVDLCYGKNKFNIEADRLQFLFSLYEEYVLPLSVSKKL